MKDVGFFDRIGASDQAIMSSVTHANLYQRVVVTVRYGLDVPTFALA
jgi:hypothetical protein